jgi:hypothetical protein
MDGSKSPGPGARRSLLIAAVVVAIVAVTQLLVAGDVSSGQSLGPHRPADAAVVWVEEPVSLVGDHARPRHEVLARSAADEPSPGWLLICSVVLLAASVLHAVHRADRRVSSPPRRRSAGIALPVLRPG